MSSARRILFLFAALSVALSASCLGVTGSDSDEGTTPNNGPSTNDGSSSDDGSSDAGHTAEVVDEADAGSDDAGGEPVCDCYVGQVCVSGTCESVDYVWLNATTSHVDDTQPTQALSVVTNQAVRDQIIGQPTRVAEQNDCYVTEPSDQNHQGTHEVTCLDAGPVTVFGVAEGTARLERDPNDASTSCYTNVVGQPGDVIFSSGQTLRAELGGGADFGSASAEVEVPSAPGFRSDEPAKGQAVNIEWTASDADEVVIFVQGFNTDTEESRTVTCLVEDTGQHTVPASLTDYFPSGVTRSHATLYRINRSVVEADGGSTVFGFQTTYARVKTWQQ